MKVQAALGHDPEFGLGLLGFVAFGQQAEPGRAIATLPEFAARWKAAPHAMAMLDEQTFNELQQQGVAMKPVFRDDLRLVVVKP